MPKTYDSDMTALEDILERLASAGYTLAEVEEMIDDALEETGFYDELDEDVDDED
jgi:predicted RNase H-like HicB family nuclease